MKKVVALLLACLMPISLAACSSGSAGSSSASGSSTTSSEASSSSSSASSSGASSTANGKKNFTIVTVPKLTGIAWFQRMQVGVQKFASDTGLNATYTGPATADAALQAQCIEDLIAKKVDAICVVPFSTQALEPVLKKARDAGIVVITQEASGMTNIDYDIEAFDNAKYGEHFMDKLAALMGGKGDYIQLVGSLTSESHMQWTGAALALQKSKYTGLKLYGDKIETSDNQNNSYNKVKEALRADPNITGIEGSAMSDVVGAALAVEELGLQGKVKIVGTSMYSVAGKYIKDGTVDMASLWDPANAGYAMNELAYQILSGQKVQDGIDLKVKGYNHLTLKGKVLTGDAWTDITKDNVNDSSVQY